MPLFLVQVAHLLMLPQVQKQSVHTCKMNQAQLRLVQMIEVTGYKEYQRMGSDLATKWATIRYVLQN